MDHRLTVERRAITAHGRRWTVQNGVGVDRIALTLDDEWEGMDSALVTLENGSASAVVAYLGEPITVPQSLLAEAGLLYVTVTGYRGDSERLVTRRMRPTEAVSVVPSGTLGVEPSKDETTPDASSHIAALESRCACLEGIIDRLLGIDVPAEATDEERRHLAGVMYDMANGAVKGVRAVPAIISRAGLEDMDCLEFDYLFPTWTEGRRYQTGDVLRWGDGLIVMTRAVGSAGALPEAGSYRVVGQDPAPSWDEWQQPFGAHDAYAKGYIVIDPTNGKTYRSTIDGNVYGPPSQYPQCWETYT